MIAREFSNLFGTARSNSEVQGLRGVLAMMVFLGHSLCFFDVGFVLNNMRSPIHILWDGQCSVCFFFLLSGYYSDRNKTLKELYLISYRKFVRLFSPQLLALVIGALFCNLYLKSHIHGVGNISSWGGQFWTEEVGIQDVLLSATMLFNRNPDLINPPSWYLGCEIRMIIVLPFVVWTLLKTNYLFGLLLVLLNIVFPQLVYINILCCYLLGVLLHHYYHLYCSRIKGNMALSNYFLFCMFVIGVLILDMKNIPGLVSYIEHVDSNTLQLFQCIGCGMVFFSILEYPNFPLFKILRTPMLIYLGNISYEFYILHFIIILILSPFFTSTFLFVITVFVISLFFSTIVYILNKKLTSKYFGF